MKIERINRRLQLGCFINSTPCLFIDSFRFLQSKLTSLQRNRSKFMRGPRSNGLLLALSSIHKILSYSGNIPALQELVFGSCIQGLNNKWNRKNRAINVLLASRRLRYSEETSMLRAWKTNLCYNGAPLPKKVKWTSPQRRLFFFILQSPVTKDLLATSSKTRLTCFAEKPTQLFGVYTQPA